MPGPRDLLRLQRDLVVRWSEYLDGASQLAATGLLEPGEWIRDYAKLWSGVIGDFGEFLRDADPVDARLAARVPIGEQIRPDQCATVRFAVRPEVFGEADEITLATAGLVKSPGGKVLGAPRHVSLVPRVVKRLDPYSELKIFNLRDAVEPGERYRGLVWTDPGNAPVATIEIEIV